MSNSVTIVMYHYVRDLEHSRFPNIKGCTVQEFNNQINYLEKYYTFINTDDLILALARQDRQLPNNAVMLTFDDGYMDHFLNVFPVLDEKGIQGCFFPSGKAVEEHCVLDVHKIQFILAAAPDNRQLIREIFSFLDIFRAEHNLKSNDYYYEKYGKATHRDAAEIRAVKSLLQRALPETCRAHITNELFRKYVSDDEESFAEELYMSLDQLKCMKRHGMHIGSHAYDHIWMDTLSPEAMETEIDLSLQFLKKLGGNQDDWSFAYPYGNGSYTHSLASLLKAKGCEFGFLDNGGIADLTTQDPFMLTRLETNDLPKD